MKKLLKQVRACTACEAHLPYPPNPVLSASSKSRIVIIGQAPGRKVQESGIPWDDQSGDNLRNWLGVSKEIFYDVDRISLIPMAFCYPGTGKSGDLPPRPECAPLWHHKLLSLIKKAELIILVGSYSQNAYLKAAKKTTLTETVQSFREYLPKYFPLPHPSPRNNIWQKKNPWFKTEVVPELQKTVARALGLNQE